MEYVDFEKKTLAIEGARKLGSAIAYLHVRTLPAMIEFTLGRHSLLEAAKFLAVCVKSPEYCAMRLLSQVGALLLKECPKEDLEEFKTEFANAYTVNHIANPHFSEGQVLALLLFNDEIHARELVILKLCEITNKAGGTWVS